jgi:hypothetical protein
MNEYKSEKIRKSRGEDGMFVDIYESYDGSRIKKRRVKNYSKRWRNLICKEER